VPVHSCQSQWQPALRSLASRATPDALQTRTSLHAIGGAASPTASTATFAAAAHARCASDRRHLPPKRRRVPWLPRMHAHLEFDSALGLAPASAKASACPRRGRTASHAAVLRATSAPLMSLRRRKCPRQRLSSPSAAGSIRCASASLTVRSGAHTSTRAGVPCARCTL